MTLISISRIQKVSHGHQEEVRPSRQTPQKGQERSKPKRRREPPDREEYERTEPTVPPSGGEGEKVTEEGHLGG